MSSQLHINASKILIVPGFFSALICEWTKYIMSKHFNSFCKCIRSMIHRVCFTVFFHTKKKLIYTKELTDFLVPTQHWIQSDPFWAQTQLRSCIITHHVATAYSRVNTQSNTHWKPFTFYHCSNNVLIAELSLWLTEGLECWFMPITADQHFYTELNTARIG